MPRDNNQTTAVKLSVADLTKTTADPSQKAGDNTATIEAIAKEFTEGTQYGTLTECPFFTHFNGTKDSMTYLGCLDASRHAALYTVQAGKGFYDPNTRLHSHPTERFRESAISNVGTSTSLSDSSVDLEKIRDEKILEDYFRRKCCPPLIPHALCVTVFLSESSFRPTIDPTSNRTMYHDVKIDVYFNGELSGSAFVSSRYHSDRYAFDKQIIRFSGCRIGRLVEKPWVFVPPGQEPDGSLREHKRTKGAYEGANQRWTRLAESLRAEVEKGGRDERGHLSILGEYLSSLAKHTLPPEVEDIQNAGGPKFGVIDVVVISGIGNKDDMTQPQLVEPTPIRVPPANILTTSDINQFTQQERKMIYCPIASHADHEILSQNSDSFNLTPRLRSQSSSTGNRKNLNEARRAETGAVEIVGLPSPSSLRNNRRTESHVAKRRSTLLTSSSSIRRTHRFDGRSPSLASDVHIDKRPRISQPSDSPVYPSTPLSTRSYFSLPEYIKRGTSTAPDPRTPANCPRKTYKYASLAVTSRDSSLKPSLKPRSRPGFEFVYDSKMTLSEEIDSIQAEAQRTQLAASQHDEEKETHLCGTHRIKQSNPELDTMSLLADPTIVPKAYFPNTNTPNASVSDVPNSSVPSANPNSKAKHVKLILCGPKPPKTLKTLSGLPAKAKNALAKAPSASPEPNSKVVKLKLSGPKLPEHVKSLSDLSIPANTPIPESGPPSPQPTLASPVAPTTPASAPGPPRASDSATRYLPRTWKTPALSQDAVLTYAADGVVRPIKMERGGQFQEMKIIMGVRFVVA